MSDMTDEMYAWVCQCLEDMKLSDCSPFVEWEPIEDIHPRQLSIKCFRASGKTYYAVATVHQGGGVTVASLDDTLGPMTAKDKHHRWITALVVGNRKERRQLAMTGKAKNYLRDAEDEIYDMILDAADETGKSPEELVMELKLV